MRPLQTIITGRKRWFFPILLSFLALSSCSKDVSHEAKVDHYYSILVQPPHDVQNASFDWIVYEFPEESNLTYSDLLITSGGNELTFLPDKAGSYIFEVVVFDGSERAASKKYTFNVTAPQIAETTAPKVSEPQPPITDSEPVEGQKDDIVFSESDSLDMSKLVLHPIPKEPIELANIYYSSDKASLTDEAKNTLDTTLLLILQENPRIIIEISAHTDSQGRDSYNKSLSQRRSESVVKYLEEKGIDKKRLQAHGYGEENLKVKDTDDNGIFLPEAGQHNRRTEFKVLGLLEEEVDDEGPAITKITENEKEAPDEPDAVKEIVPEEVPVYAPSQSRYLTIQVSASPTLRSAEAVADTLVDLGFDAYIQKGYQEKNNTVWYRVRVGTFSTMIEAQNASNAIHSITNFETWIDQVREDL